MLVFSSTELSSITVPLSIRQFLSMLLRRVIKASAFMVDWQPI
jgi:hypothetical protein